MQNKRQKIGNIKGAFGFFLLLFFPPLFVSAAQISSLSGDFTDESSVQITGSSFGSGPSTSNIQWLGGSNGAIEKGTADDIFSNCSNCTPASSLWDGGTDIFGAIKAERYSNAYAHSGTQSIKSLFDSHNYDSGFSWGNDSNRFGSIFFSYWIYPKKDTLTSGQWKQIRIRANGGVGDDSSDSLLSTWPWGDGITSGMKYFSILCGNGSQDGSVCSGGDPSALPTEALPANKHWTRVDVWMKESSAVGKDDAVLEATSYQNGSATTIRSTTTAISRSYTVSCSTGSYVDTGATLTGSLSGATAMVTGYSPSSSSPPTKLWLAKVTGTFSSGEELREGGQSGTNRCTMVGTPADEFGQWRYIAWENYWGNLGGKITINNSEGIAPAHAEYLYSEERPGGCDMRINASDVWNIGGTSYTYMETGAIKSGYSDYCATGGSGAWQIGDHIVKGEAYSVGTDRIGTFGGGEAAPRDFEIYTDDIYVQTGTRAHVEVCDSAVWANRGHCEIQYPTAWNSSSITIMLNRGSFNGGAAAFLYIIDANGNPSNAQPITFGASETGDTTPPNTPVGLSVM